MASAAASAPASGPGATRSARAKPPAEPRGRARRGAAAARVGKRRLGGRAEARHPVNYGFTVWVIVGDVLGLKVLLPP